MSEYISVALRDAIRERAGFQCEYCLLPETDIASVVPDPAGSLRSLL